MRKFTWFTLMGWIILIMWSLVTAGWLHVNSEFGLLAIPSIIWDGSFIECSLLLGFHIFMGRQFKKRSL